MKRYVLFTVVFCLSVIVLLPLDVSADFFNHRLLRDKSDSIIFGESYVIRADIDSLQVPEEESRYSPFFSLLPPEDFSKPVVVFSDSIEFDKSRVKRMKEIKGLRIDTHSIIPLDEYIGENLKKDFTARWGDNRNRVQHWSTSGKKGITDLDFALPVGETFARIVGGETRLNIDGSQRIDFSGRSEWTEGQVETSVSKNSTFPSLTMKQEPRFQIKGKVGDRISVDIKQDPQAGPLSNLEENISIKYRGEDRDIIKYIEAGNTSLTLEGATFAGYRGSHKGLFGIRSEGQLGPLKLTAIASQEKSEANIKTFRGSAEETSNQIKDYEYKSNTYFFIDFKYREQFAVARDSFDRIFYNPADSLVIIEVYADDGIIANNLDEGYLALRGVAIPMSMQDSSENPNAAVDGYFHRLDPASDYFVDRSLGFIQFNNRIQDQWTIGLYLETKSGEVYGSLEYDTTDENSKIKLKLLKPKKQRPTDLDTWNLEWKNVYDLGQRNIEPEGLEIRVYREATDGVSRDTQDGTPYIHILGLDKNDELGNPNPDNKIDLNRGFINFFRGELIFPLLEPFNSDAPPSGVTKLIKEEDRVSEIYNSQNHQEKVEASKFYIEVKTANRQSVIRVGGFGGVMEGTEQVILNGKPLVSGTDYRIEYFSGKITLLNEEALSPTADLAIRYESPEFMQQKQKTLLGVQGEYDLFSNSRIGTVLLFKNETTKDRRVKLGQEPSQILLFDTDAQFNFESRILTSALDKLPFLVANAPTKILIETEFARSMPNMNTRGMVYIDDFEGSRNTAIPIIRSNWTTASIPDVSTNLTRGRLQWYNPWNRIKSIDIWPNKETTAGENTIHVLNLAYGNPLGVPIDEAFGGIMSAFYGSGDDMSRSRFIEIWARGSKGELKIDLGSISEDFYNKKNPSSPVGDGILNTEDNPIPGQGQGDGILTKDEDTGIDGLFDKSEPGYNSNNTDPNGDNFSYNSKYKNNYTRINGTEGNSSDGDRLGIPDTEDINNNGILDTRNAYYEYTVSFDDPFNPYLVPDSVPPGDPYGWRLFRIPLWNNPLAQVGGSTPPDSTLIEYARMWITNTDSTLIQIASIEIVESTWIELGIFSTEGDKVTDEAIDRIRVASANTHENQEYYPPPGVKAEIDRETKIRKKEQSLVLKVENLDAGNSGFIYRNFEKMDFTDYTSLKMFVHGPETGVFPEAGTDESSVEFIIRFGGDRDNYYEYRTGIYRGWARENVVEVDFSKCTALKLLPGYEEFSAKPDSVRAVADTVGAKIYTIMGKASLDNVKVISIGIRNNKNNERLDCDIWVDELRMDSLRDMTGTASRVYLTTDLSGFINLTANVTRKSSDFHDMNAKKGTGRDNTDINSSVSINLDRFTPNRWKLRLPVSASVSDAKSLPRLKSGSDIILGDDQKEEYQTTSSSRKLHFTYRKGSDNTQKGITGTLIHWAFEKVDANFDWGEQNSDSPIQGQNLMDNLQTKVSYDVNPKAKSFKPLNWLPELPIDLWEQVAGSDFFYSPNQLNYSYTFNEKNQYKTNIDGVSDTTKTRTASEQINFGYSPFSSLRYNYTQSKSRDFYLKQEVQFNEGNQVTYSGPTLFNLTHNYNYSAKYNEQDNPRYSLSSQLGAKSVTLDKNFKINGSFAWQQLIEDFSGKPKPPKVRTPRKPKKVENDWKENEDVKNDKKLSQKKEEENQQQEKQKKPEEQKQRGTGVRTKVMLAVSKSLSPITFNYQENERLNYAGIEDRPDFFIRFGKGIIEPPDSMTVISRSNSASQTSSYSANTKISLPFDVGFSAVGKYDEKEQISSSSTTKSQETTFPEVNMDWSRVEEKIPFLKRFLSNCTLRTAYSLSNTKSWQNESGRPTSDKTTRKFSPIISIAARIFKDIQTNFSLSTSTQENRDISGLTDRFATIETKNTTTTVRYRLSPSGGIPFFKNMRLKSDIDFSLNFSTENRITRQSIGDEKKVITGDDSSWTLRPNAQYRFSQKFNGGVEMEFRNSKDMRDKVHIIREVSIWGQMQF